MISFLNSKYCLYAKKITLIHWFHFDIESLLMDLEIQLDHGIYDPTLQQFSKSRLIFPESLTTYKILRWLTGFEIRRESASLSRSRTRQSHSMSLFRFVSKFCDQIII